MLGRNAKSAWACWFATHAVALALAAMARAQSAGAPVGAEALKPGRDLTREFVVPEGLQVTLWAASPQLFNPTNLDIDARGRVWVTEAVNYRRFNTAKEGRLAHPNGDRVMILEDTDGDGVCDSSKVFVEDKDLTAPLGIAVFGPPNGPREVYVSCSPNLFKYVDENGDDLPDRREVFLTGFGGFDHDHGLHSLVAGPDGQFYFNCGNAGPHVVADHGGWRLRSGSIYSGGGAKDVANSGGMRSDDGRIWTGGLALAIGRDGTGLRVLAHNFRNSYEVAIDSYGDLWQNDNDDERQACRVTWLMRGANQGFFSADGRRSWQADQRPGQSVLTAHWHQDDPGVFPCGDVTGAGAPTGIVVNESAALGAEYDDALLSCDAGRNQIFLYRPRLHGAGFELHREIFLSSVPGSTEKYIWNETNADTRGWFRPSDVAIGLDGSLYVADWYDPIVGGHAMRDDLGTGRILRVSKRGSDPAAAKRLIGDFATTEQCIAALASPAIDVRGTAFAKLAADPSKLAQWCDAMRAASGVAKARLLWLIASVGAPGVATLREAFELPDPRLRILSLRAAPPAWQYPTRDELWDRAARDPSPAVRREVAGMLRGKEFDAKRDLLRTLADGFDGEDRTYLEALGLACEGSEEAIWPDFAAKLGDAPMKWSKRLAALAWRLHPVAAFEGLRVRALSQELDAAARRQAVDALAFIHDVRAADAMSEVALRGPADVRPLAAFWLRLLDAYEWKEFHPAAKLGVGQHDAKDARWRSGVVKSGVKELSVDVAGATSLWLVVHDGGDGYGFDWSDWIEPILSGPSGTTKLTELPWLVATSGWGSVQIDHDCEGGALETDGVKAAFGIGTHAESEIGFLLPAGKYTRFSAKVGPDDGGTKRSGSTTSIEFMVFADVRDGPAKARALGERMLAAATPMPERRKLAEQLALDPDGGVLLLDLAARKQLPQELQSVVAAVIFRNPDFAVRGLASEHFERTSDAGVKLPSVKELLALPADAERGRAIFFNERAGCSKCHTFAGKGADIGPELTPIRAKYGKPELFDAILNPNGAIALGYESWIFELQDGDLISGFLLADGDALVVKDTQGHRLTLAASDVKSRRRSKLSVMPDNVALGLSAQELADLVEFLKNGPVETN